MLRTPTTDASLAPRQTQLTATQIHTNETEQNSLEAQ